MSREWRKGRVSRLVEEYKVEHASLTVKVDVSPRTGTLGGRGCFVTSG
jgi:hypothetical protein